MGSTYQAGQAIVYSLPSGPVITIGTATAAPGGDVSVIFDTAPITIYGTNALPVSYWQSGVVYSGIPDGRPQSSTMATTTASPDSSTPLPSAGYVNTSSDGLGGTIIQPTQQTSGATTANTGSAGAVATSATAASASSPTAAPSNSGLSGGAVGGIAVACIVAAGLIAGLITWALMRKQLNHYRTLAAGAGAGAAAGAYSDHGHPEKGMNSSIAPVGGADTAFLAGILPVGADDKEIKQRVNNVLEGAAIHVDNFYENTKIAVPAEVAEQLAQFDSPVLGISTRNLLAQGAAPKVVITRALAETLTTSIDPQTSSSWSLLPAAFAGVEGPSSKNDRDTNVGQREQVLFWWRQLSTYLSPRTQDNKVYLETRQQTITELTRNFQTAFRPWGKAKYTPKQEADALGGTFTSAADTGVWLFGQRSTFSFAWSRNTPPGEIEVRPALVKTTDGNGRALNRPREILVRQLERIGTGAL